MTFRTENILELVRRERERQRSKYGDSHHDDLVKAPARFLSVLAEEFGEVARALNRAYLSPLAKDGERLEAEANLEEELVHTAAVAVAWLEALQRLRANGPILTDNPRPCPVCKTTTNVIEDCSRDARQAHIIEEYEERLTSAKRALTQADVPELSPDGKRPLALNERIEILAQAVREVIKDWHDNEYGYLEQKDEEVTSSMRSYITMAMQRLTGM